MSETIVQAFTFTIYAQTSLKTFLNFSIMNNFLDTFHRRVQILKNKQPKTTQHIFSPEIGSFFLGTSLPDCGISLNKYKDLSCFSHSFTQLKSTSKYLQYHPTL